MSNLKLLKILNPLLAIAFLVTALSILLSRLGYDLGNAHPTAGLIFIILSLVHFVLNWNWVKLHIFGLKRKAPKAGKQ